jgi:hypothetical protein
VKFLYTALSVILVVMAASMAIIQVNKVGDKYTKAEQGRGAEVGI